jgi:protein-L-isoaspartate(D-aspartate) O-methyltransferase
MAWRSSSSTNAGLIENLYSNSLITSPVVKAAFLGVDRAHYAPSAPYEDRPQSIGHGATISAPHMHANAVESLLEYILPAEGSQPATGEGKVIGGGGEEAPNDEEEGKREGVEGRPRRVLDIGSGSGYLTHVLAELVGEGGVVVGVEHIKELKELGERNMAKSPEGRALLASGRARFRVGDGRKGWQEPSPKGDQPAVGGDAATTSTTSNGDEGGWDAIHVGAAAIELHEELVNQLRSPGRMFIPVGADDQYIWTVDKDRNGQVTKKRRYGVKYVPLTDAPGTRKRYEL